MAPVNNVLKDLGLKDLDTKGRKYAAHPRGPRAIDREAGIRTKPMKVIVASMSRSGTLSMYAALQMLGLQPYHMAEAIKDAARDLSIANEALAANCLGEGEPFGRDEFDMWIGDFDATLDAPMTQLSLDLVKAYPEAKVVLSIRDPDKWRASILKTVVATHQWRIWGYLSYISRDAAAFKKFTDVCGRVANNWTREYYVGHNERIMKSIPANNLLVFRLGQDGFPELCKFLDLPEPSQPYPKINEGGAGLFISLNLALANYWFFKGLAETGKWLMPFVAAAGAWYAVKSGAVHRGSEWLRHLAG